MLQVVQHVIDDWCFEVIESFELEHSLSLVKAVWNPLRLDVAGVLLFGNYVSSDYHVEQEIEAK